MKLFAAIALSLTATSFAAAATPVAGSWKIYGDVSGYPVNESCTFSVDKENKVTGTCSLANKSYDVTGTLEDTKLTFKHGGEYEGQALILTWVGTVAEDGSLAGTIDVQPLGYPGTFTAKKAEDDKPKTEDKPAAAQQ